MASLEHSEGWWGAVLLGVPAFDFFVSALDNYGRLELLVRLHEQLPPILFSPTTTFVCMCAGIALLGLSQRRYTKRVMAAARSHSVLDSSGSEYRKAPPIKWPWMVASVFLVALIATPIVAVIYSLAYEGTQPPLISSITVPPIQKTGELVTIIQSTARPSPTIVNAPGGAASIGQTGGVTAGTFNQINPPFDPNAPVITYFENGETRIATPGKITGFAGPEVESFAKMKELRAANRWQDLLALCEDDMKRYPKWMTPYYYAGWAQASLGQFDSAIKLLEYVEQQTSGNLDYGNLAERANGMRGQIEEYKRQHAGASPKPQ